MTGTTDDTDRWLRRFRPSPEATARLACFPYAGGAAPYFAPVAKMLAPAVDVLAVQYPGRQDRRGEECLVSVEEMADQALPGLRPWADGSLALFGHSMGASVAFEVARRLESEGAPPRALFVSGRPAPTRNRDEGIHSLGDDAFIAELRKLGAAAAAALADEELRQMAMPSLRADYRAAETYVYRPGDHPGTDLTCPVHALIGVDDPKVTKDEAQDWQHRTSGPFTLHEFPGGHFYLDTETNDVLALIRRTLGV